MIILNCSRCKYRVVPHIITVIQTDLVSGDVVETTVICPICNNKKMKSSIDGTGNVKDMKVI
jgi:hypothetical protein